eukprot:TRINITY_DN18106_c0_g2_i1.p1 TRINITY_DN18106_c0_g2~~TRINITY_DN18106_c0_g2_i1.p1  ORF type:complete len:708 (-),score=174.86 TRINITY_DN18106_c0_g2_i1:55-2007(-)
MQAQPETQQLSEQQLQQQLQQQRLAEQAQQQLANQNQQPAQDTLETRDLFFQPGPLGVYVADVASGRVTDVFEGQAKAQGVRPYFQMLAIDGEPYSEALIEQKKAGAVPYRMTIRQLPTPDVELQLECVHAMSVDLSRLPPEARCLDLALQRGVPCIFGRAHQAELIHTIMPDGELRNCISRNHFDISWDGQSVIFRRLSVNSMFVDEVFAPQNVNMHVRSGAHLALCSDSDDAGGTLPGNCMGVMGGARGLKGSRREKNACANPLAKILPSKEDEGDEEGRMPFMVFMVSVKKINGRPTPLASPPPAPLQGAACPPAMASPSGGPVSPYLVVCTMSLGRDVSSLPLSRRAVPLGESLTLGRQHQGEFFEAVMGHNHPFWTAVSRSHLEISAAPGQRGAFLIRNLSVNHVLVGERQLQRGEQGSTTLKGSIDFLASDDAQGAMPKCFLRISIESATPGAAAVASPQPAHHPAALQGAQPGMAGGFWVELSGSAVRPDVSHAMRKVMASPGLASNGKGAGLVVGRAWQHELHKAALAEAALTFVSREHFRVEESESSMVSMGQDPFMASAFPSPAADLRPCCLVALSQNPIWRQRGNDIVQLGQQESLPLEPGDRILLFTGASDGTPNGPGNAGSIAWTFCKDGPGPHGAH